MPLVHSLLVAWFDMPMCPGRECFDTVFHPRGVRAAAEYRFGPTLASDPGWGILRASLLERPARRPRIDASRTELDVSLVGDRERRAVAIREGAGRVTRQLSRRRQVPRERRDHAGREIERPAVVAGAILQRAGKQLDVLDRPIPPAARFTHGVVDGLAGSARAVAGAAAISSDPASAIMDVRSTITESTRRWRTRFMGASARKRTLPVNQRGRLVFCTHTHRRVGRLR